MKRALLICAGLGLCTGLVAHAVGQPTTGDAGAPAAAADGGVTSVVPRNTVRVVIQTVPATKARVTWGKRQLGLIRGRGRPLTVERPRESGPMDLVIHAEGCLPVHTRAHTFSDHKLFVKVTPVAEKKSLFGYREELPADTVAPPDGGVAPAPAPLSDGSTP